ncbi:MAG: DUF2935 domain-containing protein [Syntrophomonas sp.]
MPGELTPTRYASKSLELNLFFLRIMKEHSLLIEASFPAKDAGLAAQADAFKNKFHDLLVEVVPMADGHISPAVLKSGEIVTDDTEKLEEMTHQFTGIVIDTTLTQSEMQLKPGLGDLKMESEISLLNNRAINLTKSLIQFKTKLLSEKKNCVIFTEMFYSELEHLRDEAQHYVSELQALQQRQDPNTKKSIINEKVFWDDKMADHAEFIEHLLDPSEKAWITRARGLASRFHRLETRADAAQGKGILNKRLRTLLLDEITATKSLAGLKDTIADAYQECKVKALFLPIWPDHVMREAFHFLREMRDYYNMNG